MADDLPQDDRLDRQLSFLLELDRLKQVFRQTYLADGSRRENDAEHSWHLAVYALVLAEHAPPGIDVARAMKMALVHDVVEIDAGDTFLYDVPANRDKAEREKRAADRLFALLPPDQTAEVRGLWEEFEARATPEARYAAALDRVQSILNNVATRGRSWREHGVTADQILERLRHVEDGSPRLARHVRDVIGRAQAAGWLR